MTRLTPIRRSDFASRADILLLLFLIFMTYAYYVSYEDHKGLFMWVSTSNDPYFSYYSNSGIKVLNNLAWSVDVFCLAFLMLRFFSHVRIITLIVSVLCIVGAVLPWLELYWGSTFYYGEVRDKQQLPFLVNNFGVIGSVIFCYSFVSINFPSHRFYIASIMLVAQILMGISLGYVWNW